MNEAKAREARGDEKIHVNWLDIPLPIFRSDRPGLMALGEFPEGPLDETREAALRREDEVLRVRAAKGAVLAYCTQAIQAARGLSGRDGSALWEPLREDLETDTCASVMTRRHLEWAMRHLGNEDALAAGSVAIWRRYVAAYLRSRLDEAVGPDDAR